MTTMTTVSSTMSMSVSKATLVGFPREPLTMTAMGVKMLKKTLTMTMTAFVTRTMIVAWANSIGLRPPRTITILMVAGI